MRQRTSRPFWALMLTLCVGCAVSAAASRVNLVTRANEDGTVEITEPWEGTYFNEGKASTRLKFKNRSGRRVTFFLRFPGETAWRQTHTAEPESEPLVTGLEPGVYGVAAMRNRVGLPGYEFPGHWAWGPVELKVKRRGTSVWKVKN